MCGGAWEGGNPLISSAVHSMFYFTAVARFYPVYMLKSLPSRFSFREEEKNAVFDDGLFSWIRGKGERWWTKYAHDYASALIMIENMETWTRIRNED